MTKKMIKKAGVLFLVFCFLFTLNITSEQEVYAAAKKIVKEAIPGTVFIVSCNKGSLRPRGTGTGVMIHPDGYLVTNFHNIGSTRSGIISRDIYAYFVTKSNLFGPPNPRAYKIKILKTNYKYDLVLGKIIGYQSGRYFRRLSRRVRFSYVKVGDSSEMEPSDAIFALGFPSVARTSRKFFSGITVLNGQIVGLDTQMKWIKINAEIAPGNSGGPSINSKGQVIGINTAVRSERRTGGRISLMRPINLARHLAKGTPAFKFFKKGPNLQADKRRIDKGGGNGGNKQRDGSDYEREDGGSGYESDHGGSGQRGQSFVIYGKVRSADSRSPIGGALCVMMRLGSSLPIRKSDIVAFGRSNYSGRFRMNRRVAQGRYMFVAIHRNFRTIRSAVVVHRRSYFFTVTMAEK